jgi:hypothetical protein
MKSQSAVFVAASGANLRLCQDEFAPEATYSSSAFSMPHHYCSSSQLLAPQSAPAGPWRRCKSSQQHGLLLRFSPCHESESIAFPGTSIDEAEH